MYATYANCQTLKVHLKKFNSLLFNLPIVAPTYIISWASTTACLLKTCCFEEITGWLNEAMIMMEAFGYINKVQRKVNQQSKLRPR